MTSSMKKFNQRMVATVTTVGILATMLPSVYAIEAMPDAEGDKVVKDVVNAKLMSLYSDGTFRPAEVMQRQKLARFIDAALKYRNPALDGYDEHKNYSSILTDVSSSDFYFPYIASMNDKGVINGYPDKTFKGTQNVTRGEALAMMIRAYKLIQNLEIPDYKANPSLLKTTHRFKDVTSSNGFYNTIYFALEKGWIKGLENFRVNDKISKYEIAMLFHRILLENGRAIKDNSNNSGTNLADLFWTGKQMTLTDVKGVATNKDLIKLVVKTPPEMQQKLIKFDKNKFFLKIDNATYSGNNIEKITLISRKGNEAIYGIIVNPKNINKNSIIELGYEDNHAKISPHIVVDSQNVSNTTVSNTPNNNNTNTNNGVSPINNGNNTAATGTPATGSVTLSLASDNPASQFVPKNATNVEMLKMNLNAQSNTDIRTITVTRTGLGNASDIKSLKLFINGIQAGGERTLNYSTNSTTFYIPTEMQRFLTGDSTITIKADFNNVGGSYSRIVVSGVNDIASPGTVNGSFPISGNEVQTAGIEAGKINLTTYSGAGGTYYIGDKDKELGKFDLAATSTEGAEIKTIRMRAYGTAKITDVGNLTLKTNDGKVVSSKATVTADGFVTFDLVKDGKGYALDRGAMQTFYVKGDVVSGRSDSTIGFDFESSGDVMAVGTTYKFGVPVEKTSSSTRVTPYAIKGGKISAALANSSSQSRDVSPRTNNVELASYSFTTQGDGVRLKGLKLALVATDKHSTTPNASASEIAKTSNLEGVKIVVGNNEYVYGPLDLAQPNSDVTYTLANNGIDGVNHATGTLSNNGVDTRIISIDDYITLPANKTTNIKVVANVSSNAAKGDTYQAKLLLTKADGNLVFSGENENNREAIRSSDLTPSGANAKIDGNIFTVNTSNLSFALRALPGSKAVAKGAKDVELYGFTASVGSASDVKLRSIKISRDSDMPNSSIQDLENLKLYMNGKLISGNGKSFVDAGTDYVMFDNLTMGDNNNPLTLKGGQQYEFTLKADISNNAQMGNKGRFFIENINDIDALDMNGTSLRADQKRFLDSNINSNVDTQSPVYTVQQGGVTVSVDNSTPVSGHLTAGDKAQKVFTFRISSKNEAVYLKTLNLAVMSTPGNVYKLTLEKDGKQVGGERTVIGGVASWNLTGSDRILLEAGKDALITVKADVMTSDNSVAQSGRAFQIGFAQNDPIKVESLSGDSSQIIGFKGTTTKPAGALAENLSSTIASVTLAAAHTTLNAGDILRVNNEEMLVTKKVSDTKFDVVRGVNGTTPTSHIQNAVVNVFDGSKVEEVKSKDFTVFYARATSITAGNLPTTLLQVGQNQVIGSFDFKTAANTDAANNSFILKTLRLRVAGNAQVSNVKLYNKKDSSVVVDGVISDNGKTLTFDLSNMSGGNNYIGENLNGTFEIKGLINYIPANGTLSLNLNDIDGASLADSDIVWSDGVGDYSTVKINSETVTGRVMTSSSTVPAGTPIY